MKMRPGKLAVVGAMVAAALLFAGCGGGGGGGGSPTSTTSAPGSSSGASSGATTSGTSAQAAAQSPAVTNTIASGVFTSWTQGNPISSSVSLPSDGSQPVFIVGAATPFWTGSDLVIQGAFAGSPPGTPIGESSRQITAARAGI
jgi:hypothetical protein